MKANIEFQWPIVFRDRIKPKPLSGALYVGRIAVSMDQLVDLRVEFYIAGFNATNRTLRIPEPIGQMALIRKIPEIPDTKILLPKPVIADAFSREVSPLSIINISLQQSVPREAATYVDEVLDQGGKVNFELEGLTFKFHTIDDPKGEALLPLWDGVSCAKGPFGIAAVENRYIRAVGIIGRPH